MTTFKGAARRLDDIDLPRLGAQIGVGEDEIHAVLDVESRGSGFDGQGRVLALFEPHVFWRNLGGEKRERAVKAGLAYPKWGDRPYPADSYPRILAACAIDETAALKATSWGLGQILGENHRAAGYNTPQAMVAGFVDDEEAHLAAMIKFIQSKRLDRYLRAHDWDAFARGYNGSSYQKNDYAGRLSRAYARWAKIPDTRWNPLDAAVETAGNDPAAAHVTVIIPPATSPSPPVPAPATPVGFWARVASSLLAILSRRSTHA